MERNENGTPIMPRTNGNSGALGDFFGTQNKGDMQREAPPRTEGNDMPEGCRRMQNGNTGTDKCLDSLPLAYAYVPWQKWRLLYSHDEALKNGTLFEELNKPLGVYGNE